jgi:phosphoribosylaminoimidazole-succinocarboxamide synthase
MAWCARQKGRRHACAQVSAAALALFQFGQAQARQRGLLLVDTKYEFGVDAGGQIRLVDEVHTPDSSRCFTFCSALTYT